jgi:hypothetical protein
MNRFLLSVILAAGLIAACKPSQKLPNANIDRNDLNQVAGLIFTAFQQQDHAMIKPYLPGEAEFREVLNVALSADTTKKVDKAFILAALEEQMSDMLSESLLRSEATFHQIYNRFADAGVHWKQAKLSKVTFENADNNAFGGIQIKHLIMEVEYKALKRTIRLNSCMKLKQGWVLGESFDDI